MILFLLLIIAFIVVPLQIFTIARKNSAFKTLQMLFDLELQKNEQWRKDYQDLQADYQTILANLKSTTTQRDLFEQNMYTAKKSYETLKTQFDQVVADLNIAADEINRLIGTRTLLEKELADCKSTKENPIGTGGSNPNLSSTRTALTTDYKVKKDKR